MKVILTLVMTSWNSAKVLHFDNFDNHLIKLTFGVKFRVKFRFLSKAAKMSETRVHFTRRTAHR